MVEEVKALSPNRAVRRTVKPEAARFATDEERFRSLFRAYYQAIFAYAARRTVAAGIDPDDVVAETFAIAWKRRASLPAARELPYLYGIAARVLANQRRSQRRALRLYERLRVFARVHHVSAEDETAARAQVGSVAAAFTSLPDSDAEVLRLAIWEGLSSSEMALVLGCSKNAAAIRLHRARKRLETAVLKESGSTGHREERNDQHPADGGSLR